MYEEEIAIKVRELPDNLKKEVLDYADFLHAKLRKDKSRRGFKFDWEGGLADIGEDISSVELQHRASEWR